MKNPVFVPLSFEGGASNTPPRFTNNRPLGFTAYGIAEFKLFCKFDYFTVTFPEEEFEPFKADLAQLGITEWFDAGQTKDYFHRYISPQGLELLVGQRRGWKTDLDGKPTVRRFKFEIKGTPLDFLPFSFDRLALLVSDYRWKITRSDLAIDFFNSPVTFSRIRDAALKKLCHGAARKLHVTHHIPQAKDQKSYYTINCGRYGSKGFTQFYDKLKQLQDKQDWDFLHRVKLIVGEIKSWIRCESRLRDNKANDFFSKYLEVLKSESDPDSDGTILLNGDRLNKFELIRATVVSVIDFLHDGDKNLDRRKRLKFWQAAIGDAKRFRFQTYPKKHGFFRSMREVERNVSPRLAMLLQGFSKLCGGDFTMGKKHFIDFIWHLVSVGTERLSSKHEQIIRGASLIELYNYTNSS